MLRKLASLALAALLLSFAAEVAAQTPPAIRFDTNNSVGITRAGLGCSGDAAVACAEPSGASGNGVIFVSANWAMA